MGESQEKDHDDDGDDGDDDGAATVARFNIAPRSWTAMQMRVCRASAEGF